MKNVPDRKGYDLEEGGRCTFISIKRMGYIFGTKWPPTIRTVARCTGEGDTWTERREFTYAKGELTSKDLDKKR
jgi:hypothetical protein